MVGVILFRAQPFHRGHLNMVQKAFSDCENNNCDLYIFVGSAGYCGTDYEEYKAFPDDTTKDQLADEAFEKEMEEKYPRYDYNSDLVTEII